MATESLATEPLATARLRQWRAAAVGAGDGAGRRPEGARAGATRRIGELRRGGVQAANPFTPCLMSGEEMRNPFPHSRFVGLIPGGIMNGIAGNPDGQPILDQEYGMDWRTCEYCRPHGAYDFAALGGLDA